MLVISCNTQHFKMIIGIVANKIILGHTGFLKILYNFYNTDINNIQI